MVLTDEEIYYKKGYNNISSNISIQNSIVEYCIVIFMKTLILKQYILIPNDIIKCKTNNLRLRNRQE